MVTQQCLVLIMYNFSSGRYILSQYKGTNYNPLNGLRPKKSFICCLMLSTVITIYSEVSIILLIRYLTKI